MSSLQTDSGKAVKRRAGGPSRWWYLIALVVLATGLTFFILTVASVKQHIREEIPKLTRVVVPSSSTVQLESTGRYTVYYEWISEAGGQQFETMREEPAMALSVTGPEGEALKVSDPETARQYRPESNAAGYAGTTFRQFQVDEPGAYTLSASYEPEAGRKPRIVLALGQLDIDRLIMSGALGLNGAGGLAAISIVIALVISVLTFASRLRARSGLDQ